MGDCRIRRGVRILSDECTWLGERERVRARDTVCRKHRYAQPPDTKISIKNPLEKLALRWPGAVSVATRFSRSVLRARVGVFLCARVCV